MKASKVFTTARPYPPAHAEIPGDGTSRLVYWKNAWHGAMARLSHLKTLGRDTHETIFCSARMPVVEPLGERMMMSAVPLGIAEVAVDGGSQLRISGTSGNDLITLKQTSAGLVIGNNGGWTKTVAGDLNSLWINGAAGNNSITLDKSVTLNATIFGGGGNDTIVAGSGNNVMYGGTGKNVLQSRTGNDTLVCLGSTADTLMGGTGHDSFWTDGTKAEKIQNLTPAETAAGAVHSVANFYNASSISFTSTKNVPSNSKTAFAAVRIKEPTADPSTSYTSVANNPVFSSAGPSENDVFQGNADDCYFLSVLSSVAKLDPTRIEQSVLDMGDGTAVVELYKNNKPVFVREDELLPSSNGTLSYAGLGADNSSWVALMEKAFCYVRTNKTSYSAIGLGWMDEAYRALGCTNPVSTYTVANATALMNVINKALTAGQSVTCAISTAPPGSGLVSDHAYTIDKMSVDSKGNLAAVTLRNPWGCGADGTGDGYITISAATAFKALEGVVSARV